MIMKRSISICALVLSICASMFFSFFPFALQAQQTTNGPQTTTVNGGSPININDSSFKLVACDGPTLPKGMTPPTTPYVPCDFNGLMLTIQRFINVGIVVGVFAALIGFAYTGALYVMGTPKYRERANEVFPKLFWGFIIMLSAWFIVYQILSWLTSNSAFTSLLGK